MKWWDFVTTVLLFFCIILLVRNVSLLKTDGGQCLENPLVYGSEQLKMRNNAEFNCVCTVDKPNSPLIIFNSEGMVVEFQSKEQTDVFDWGNITLNNPP